MKKFAALTLLTVLVVLFAGILTVSSQISKSAQSQVFNLSVDGDSICTCFNVENARHEHYIVSAGHCVRHMQESSKVFARSPEAGTQYELKLRASAEAWPNTDFAIFTYVGASPDGGLTLTSNIPSPGDEVWSMVGPRGLAPIMVRGLFAGRARLADEPDHEVNGMYAITGITAAGGASGSPMFDSQGHVWGILVGGNPFIPGFAMIVGVPLER